MWGGKKVKMGNATASIKKERGRERESTLSANLRHHP
jgi:hypothetical protein